MIQNWIFYYVTKNNKTCLFNRYKCIKPAYTNMWKYLQQFGNSHDDIKEWGYSIETEYINGIKASNIKPERHQELPIIFES